MGVINVGELKGGVKLLFNNEPYLCIGVDFVKPGKGAAMYKIKVQNLLTSNVLDKTLRSGDKCDTADVVDAEMEYLYYDASGYVFMNIKTFDQVTVPAKAVGDRKDLLVENMPVRVTLWNDQPIAVELPTNYTYTVKYTEPAVKGDTQSRVMKEAELQTGAKAQVPTFVAIGDKVTINTTTKAYVGREKG